MALVLLGLGATPARADWSGDGKPDVLAVHPDGRLLMYRTDGAGAFAAGGGVAIGSGWAGFTAVLAPGDFSGDGKPDLLARTSAGALLTYRGDGDGGFATGRGEQIGSGWQSFTALFAAGDFSGDGMPDLLARRPDGGLLLYRGDGAGGFAGPGELVGSGWQPFTAVFGGGDFSGDQKADVLARDAGGALLLYRGNGASGWVTGRPETVGSGWGSLGSLMLLTDPPRAAPAPPPPAPAPASAPLPDGRVRLTVGIRCTPPGGRLRVSLRVRRRAGHARPHVRRVVFFVRNGARRVDRTPPYAVRLRLRLPAGTRGRVYARVTFVRGSSKRLHHKTVSRRFVICG